MTAFHHKIPAHIAAGPATSTDQNIGAPKLPEFPAHVLPEVLRNMVEAVALELEAPLAAPGTLALALLGAIFQGRFVAQIREGWEEQLSIYAAVVLPSGEGKSPVFKAMLGPLVEHMRDEWARVKPEYEEKLGRHRAAKLAYEHSLKPSRKIDKAPTNPIDASMPWTRQSTLAELLACPAPNRPPMLLDDTTQEAIVECLSSSYGAATIAVPEGDGFVQRVLGLYSATRSAPQDVFLKAYNGESISVNRKGREPILVERPHLSILVMMQPAVLEKMLGSEMSSTGLLARFCLCAPESKLGRRTRDTPAVPATTALDYGALVRSLASWAGLPGNPRTVRFAPDAFEALRRYERLIEPRFVSDYRFIKPWANKSAGLIARIAAMFALVEERANAVVTDQYVERAKVLVEYYLGQTRTLVLGAMPAESPHAMDEAKLRVKFGSSAFQKREMHRILRKNGSELSRAIDDLVDAGVMLQVSPPQGRKGAVYRLISAAPA